MVLVLEQRSATAKIKTAMAWWMTKRRAPQDSGAHSGNARLVARKANFNVARIVCALMDCACKPNAFEHLVIRDSVATLSAAALTAAKASNVPTDSDATMDLVLAVRWMVVPQGNFAEVTSVKPILA